MKAMILAGRFGARLSEATIVKPKPMVEIASMTSRAVQPVGRFVMSSVMVSSEPV